MRRHSLPKILAISAVLAASWPALAQTPESNPNPGPTAPVPPSSTGRPIETMVINPTTEECRQGWSNGMRWTKEQFDGFCEQMQRAK